MGYRYFELKVTLFVLLIASTAAIFVIAMQFNHLLFTKITLAIIWIAEVLGLIYYVKKISRDLATFLNTFHIPSTIYNQSLLKIVTF